MDTMTVLLWVWLVVVFFIIFWKLTVIEKVMGVLVDEGRRPPEARA